MKHSAIRRHYANQTAHDKESPEATIAIFSIDIAEWRHADLLMLRDEINALIERINRGDIETNDITGRLEK